MLVALMLSGIGCDEGPARAPQEPVQEAPGTPPSGEAPAGEAPPAPEEPPVQVEPDTPAADPEPEEAPSADRIPPEAADAVRAYRAVLARFNRMEESAYFASYSDPVECLFGRRSVPVSRLRQQRRFSDLQHIIAIEITVVRANADEVILVDHGAFKDERPSHRLHDKLVTLRRAGQGWRIAVEDSARTHRCYGEGFTVPPPSPRWARCAARHAQCLVEGERSCFGDPEDPDEEPEDYGEEDIGFACSEYATPCEEEMEECLERSFRR